MRFDRIGLALVGLLILSPFTVCAGIDLAGISGFYYQDDLEHPLPGALIALYDADDNLLVDYTYTLANGRFRLKGASTKGKYYIVATKDQFSQRLDFDYDPQTPLTNLMIQHHQPKSRLAKLRDYLGNTFDDVIKVLIGLILGLGFKVYDDRKKARQTIDREIKAIRDSRDDIVNNYQKLLETAKAYGGSSGSDANNRRAEYVQTAIMIGTQVEDLQKLLKEKTEFEEAIYTIRRRSGRDDYANLRRTLREIKTLTDTVVANRGTTLDASNRDAQMKSFNELQDNNLLK